MMPYHPLVIHFPIAFYFLESGLLLFWIFKKDPAYHRFALFTFRAGYLGMLLAAMTGWIDAGGWHHVLEHVRLHFFAACTVFLFYTLRAVYWKTGKLQSPSYPFLLIGSALLGNILIMVTGFFGGKLVYGS